MDGDFSLSIKNAKNKLSVSYIGYKAQKLAIGAKTSFQIKLVDESRAVDEVVVTARKRASGESGFNISQRELSMAVAT